MLSPVRVATLAFAILNAVLYSALLPLWEGFDEAFHYGYVESVRQTGTLPVLGRSLLPAEIEASFRVAPLSYIVRRWIPQGTAYDDWFALPFEVRSQRRSELGALRPQRGVSTVPNDSTRPNYEAHHPPLAYLTLLPLDAALGGRPIITRVLLLRIAGAISSVVLLFFGGIALFGELALKGPFADACLFSIFCSQMLYATVAHVANDWLAVGCGAFAIATLVRLWRAPSGRYAYAAALWLGAGLLTKAYFLVFAVLWLAVVILLGGTRKLALRPLLLSALLLLGIAGPWYARNVWLYKNVSGTHEAFDGIGFKQAIAAAPRVNWKAAAGFLSRGSLWTGNNLFTSFSAGTLNLMLGLLALGFLLWCVHPSLMRRAEWLTLAFVALFALAVAYATCASFADKPEVVAASPWYTQVMLLPVLSLVHLGLERTGTSGRNILGTALACCHVLLCTWVLAATWIVKLFPAYSGAGTAPLRLRELWHWYLQGAGARAPDLSLTALAPAPLLYCGMAASVALAVVMSVWIVRRLAGHARIAN